MAPMGEPGKGGWLRRAFPGMYPSSTVAASDGWTNPDLPDQPPYPTPHGEGITTRLAAAQAARVAPLVTTRDLAMKNSVVNRARDIVCGVLASLPLQVTRDRAGVRETLDPGWLRRPDPAHSAGWFKSWVTDDLFFHGVAAARITVEDADTHRAIALQWMPWTQLESTPGGTELVWRRGWYPDPFTPQAGLPDVELQERDLVLWELPLAGLLNGGDVALTTAAQLDRSANRFAGAELAAGYLRQIGGEPTAPADAQTLLDTWTTSRVLNVVGFLNETLEYHESEMDPSRLQLVEGRSYQDAQTARLCNMPNWTVGVGVPGDSMTYKTALTARLDLLDFGLGPFVQCWGEALSSDKVTPHGTTVDFDLEPFLRTQQLGALAAAGVESAPTPAAPTPGGSPNA